MIYLRKKGKKMTSKQYTTILNILLDIIKRLYLGEKLTTKNIANDYEVSVRTAQRYIKYLESAGFNIQREGMYYYLTTIVDENQEVLFETIEAIIKNAGLEKDIMPLLKKLKIINKESVFYSKLDIEKVDINLFSTLESAIREKKVVKIQYKKDNKILTLTLKPLKITNFEGYWYLNALDMKNKYITLHLKSIQNVKIENKTFKVKKDILKNLEKAVNIWFDPTKETIQVELFADEYATKYLERLPISSTQKIIKNSDNTSTIYVEITDKMEILRKLLMWIPNLVVIEPKWLKEEVDSMIDSYIEKFKN